MAVKKVQLTFCGGAGEVTGSNFLLEDEGTKILIDCGMIQTRKTADDRNFEPFLYNPKTIDALFVTHAHLDHIGRIPRLVEQGYVGPIYSTFPTKRIAEVMLIDSLGVLTKEAKRENTPLVYTEADIPNSMRLWKTVAYHEPVTVGPFSVALRDSGHILGSAMMEVTYNGKKILFTGDLGNSPAPFLNDTEKVTDADYLVMESVYGDRNHEPHEEKRKRTEEAIEDTVKQGGVLIIPAFSLERTQDLLFEINNLVENGRIPRIPIYLDSPLAIKVTKIYKESEDFFNKATRHQIKSGDDIFNFPGLRMTLTTEESKEIKGTPNPKVIIAGSGMSNGGRIIHHEKLYLPDPKSTLLLVGYQSIGTPGRLMQEGVKKIKILGEEVQINARVVNIFGYSSHKDSDHLFAFAEDMADRVQKVFVVMGEPKSSFFLTQRLRDYLGLDAVVPERGESVSLEC